MTQPDEDRTAHDIDTPPMPENPHGPAAAFPRPPWRLCGAGLVGSRLVEVARARPFVPEGLRILHVLPGRTVGGIYLARYGPGSTLEYGELIVMPALVCRGWRVGAWVSHIYVDSAASLAGGRTVWGLPKQLAAFEWQAGRVTVRQDGVALCSVQYEERAGGLPVRFPLPAFGLPAFGLPAGRLARFTAQARARVLPLRAVWTIPPDSPVATLGLSGRGVTLRLEELRAMVPAPVNG